jgi:hypothetical protein
MKKLKSKDSSNVTSTIVIRYFKTQFRYNVLPSRERSIYMQMIVFAFNSF